MQKSKLIDGVLVFLILAAGVFFFRFVRGGLALEAKVNLQAMQANSLIEEVGQTKEENRMLYEKLENAQVELHSLKSNLADAAKPSFSTPIVAEEAKVLRPQALPEPAQTTNFLVVGHHQRLADTIMMASVNESAQKITFISIPRDLFVNGRKINEYLSLYGAQTLKEKVEAVTGLAIHHTVVIDFEAFETIIDAFGGIDVNVEKAIYDPLYPNGRGGYTVYSIVAGSHHLSGAEALQYARSRHSTSDFDRAKRQQQILTAIQERVLNMDFVGDFGKLKEVFGALLGSVETDMSLDEIIAYATSFRYFPIESGNVISTENFLYSSANIAGQYILLPRGGNWGKIQRYVRELLAKVL